MFSLLKNTFNTLYNSLSSGLSTLFSRTTVDEQTMRDLEKLLIEADVGYATTNVILKQVTEELGSGHHDGKALHAALEKVLKNILTFADMQTPSIYILVGVNGSGKTTAAAKLANMLKKENKKVLLIAADTFRAAGMTQLKTWADRIGVDCIVGAPGQDPASVIYAGAQHFKSSRYDTLIIDTAGRLQTKINLMKELEKIKKVITTQLPTHSSLTLLTIDAMLGQNSLDQAKVFNESVKLDGIILTKLDGTGKGGIVFALVQQLHVPIRYITLGETVESLQTFNTDELIRKLFS